ncbi:MAG: SH3 domain-containing protein [Anaerolineae bacterium]|nr:SH3 domain-containing protein [Anaerolineae bacterium]
MKRLIVVFMSVVFIGSLLGAQPTPSYAAPAGQASQLALQTETGIVATVKAERLNVRRAPRAGGGSLGFLTRNSVVPLIGRDRVGAWLQAVTPFGIGWISARWVSTNVSIVNLPVTEDQILPFATVITSAVVFVRRGPAVEYAIVDRLRFGDEVDVVGLHSKNTHVEVITPRGRRGWVVAQAVRTEGDLSQLPFSDLTVTPLAKVNTFRLRVRQQPSDIAPVIGVARLGISYDIVGVTPDGLWLQITGDFGRGWVARRFVTVIGNLGQFGLSH